MSDWRIGSMQGRDVMLFDREEPIAEVLDFGRKGERSRAQKAIALTDVLREREQLLHSLHADRDRYEAQLNEMRERHALENVGLRAQLDALMESCSAVVAARPPPPLVLDGALLERAEKAEAALAALKVLARAIAAIRALKRAGPALGSVVLSAEEVVELKRAGTACCETLEADYGHTLAEAMELRAALAFLGGGK